MTSKRVRSVSGEPFSPSSIPSSASLSGTRKKVIGPDTRRSWWFIVSLDVDRRSLFVLVLVLVLVYGQEEKQLAVWDDPDFIIVR